MIVNQRTFFLFFQELESLFSDHFGRTPLTTPACSQEEDGSGEGVAIELEHSVVNDVVDGRVRQFVNSKDSDTGAEEHDNIACEDDNSVSGRGSSDDEFDSEKVKISKFLKDGCQCKLECSERLTKKMIQDNIYTVREMTKAEKEMYIMGTLKHRNDGEKTKRGKKRVRSRVAYTFNGTDICRPAYMLLFDIGNYALKSLVQYMKAGGHTPRSHGNTGRTPKHAVIYDDVRRVVDFLTNYADTYGLPQPAAPRGTDNIPPIYLEAHTTKICLHKQYMSICEEQSVRALKHTAFYEIWENCLPHIKIASPREDVCATCECHRKSIMLAVEEEEKLEATQSYTEHIERAKIERAVYNTCIQRAKLTYCGPPEDRYNHYTFDFCQGVSIPHFSRQLGPTYFATLRKAQIFGVRIDGEPRQLNFLLDESETIGSDGSNTHGPNAVISMLHYALEVNGQEERHIALHADNCPGNSW